MMSCVKSASCALRIHRALPLPPQSLPLPRRPWSPRVRLKPPLYRGSH